MQNLSAIFHKSNENDLEEWLPGLFSFNAHRFIPLDGPADVAEYTTKRIIGLIGLQAP
jgi:hypothetical protein